MKAKAQIPALTGSAASRLVLRFGTFEVVPAAEELRKSGVKIRLTGQPFQILLLLLERPGEIVTRDTLRRKLWPEDTFVDFNHCLNTAVNKLREALGDSAENPRFIETVPRRGYRFLAPVERIGPPPEPPVRPDATAPSPGIRRLAAPIAAAGLAVVILVAIAWFGHGPASEIATPPTPTPFTRLPGSETTPSFSPNGATLAFAWNGRDRSNYDIYVQALGSETPQRITQSPGDDFAPEYSPDGSRIAFYRRTGDTAALYVISTDTWRETRVMGLDFGPPGPASAFAGIPATERISWSPDGNILAYVDKESPAEPLSVYLRVIDTRHNLRVTWPPENTPGDSSPAISPDGQLLAFIRRTAGLLGDLYVVPLTGGAARRLTRDNSRIHGLAWTPDGRYIVFSSSRRGETTLWKVPAAGGEPVSITGAGPNAILPAVSPAGGRLAFVRYASDNVIWRVPIGETSYRKRLSERLELPVRSASNPRLSPDGTRLAFVFNSPRGGELWASDPDGSNAVRLVSFPKPLGSPRWSPDSRRIAFDSALRGNWDIYVVGLDGDPPQPLVTGSGEDVRPSWSRDGRWVYFGSDRSGTAQVWKVSTDGGEMVQVTRHGGYEGVESTDGKFLYYNRRSVPGLWRTPVEGGDETLFLEELQWENSRNWVLTERGVFFVSWKQVQPLERSWSVEFVPYDRSEIREVAALGTGRVVDSGCSISPDGRWLLYVRANEEETNIVMVENFR